MTPKDITRFFKYVTISNGCWEWTGWRSRGYGRFRIGKEIYFSHRIIYMIYNGWLERSYNLRNHVLHKCDNRSCVRPDHLFLGTNNDNIADMVQKGRQSRGTKHSEAIKRGLP